MVFVYCFKVDSGVIFECADILNCSVGRTRDIISKKSIIDNIKTNACVFCLIVLIESRQKLSS